MNNHLIRIVFKCVVVAWSISLLLIVPVHTQDGSAVPVQSGESSAGENTSPSIVQEVNSSVELIENKRERINQLKSRKLQLEEEVANITLEIVEIQQRITEIEAQAIKDEVDPESIEIQVNAETKTLSVLQRDLNVKQTELDSKKEQITSIDSQILELQSLLDQEVNDFRGEIVVNSATTVSYIFLIIGYWVVFEIAQIVINRFAPKRLHGLIRISLIALASIATLITLFVALAARIEFIFASIGVISAALVVALQDMVSSFFGWILILTQNQYRKDHIIRIGQDTDAITGVVTKIGFLRTYMNERVGVKSEIDAEQSTGKVLSFPNNKLFTAPLVNFSVNDPYLWYSLSIIITFESDANLAYTVLTEFIHDWYEENTTIKGVRQKKEHEPKVYVHIAGDGPCYTIWYSAKIGEYRDTLKSLSLSLLELLSKHNLDLAYTTVRTVGDLEISRPDPK